MADVLLEEHAKVETLVRRLLEIGGDTTLKPGENVRAAATLTRLVDQAFGRVKPADAPDPDDEETPWDAMTPTQRAKARAGIAALLAERELLDEADLPGPRVDAHPPPRAWDSRA